MQPARQRGESHPSAPSGANRYGGRMAELLHITERVCWDDAVRAGEYGMSTRGVTLEQEGYIHCSLPHQLRAVAELVYRDADDLVVLVVDSELVPADIRYEAPTPGGERYPHIYGALPVGAVTKVVSVTRDGSGQMILPD
jgi:uncharacterized protein (DUF952 family)